MVRTAPRLHITGAPVTYDPHVHEPDLPQIAYDVIESPARLQIARLVADGMPRHEAMQKGLDQYEKDVSDGSFGNERTHCGHRSIVYYMRMDRLIKIGTTIDIAGRVATIMPQGVVAVEFGGAQLEHERHRQFKEHHSHGEWFWLREPLTEHIVALREAFPAVGQMSVEDWLLRHGARSTALA